PTRVFDLKQVAADVSPLTTVTEQSEPAHVGCSKSERKIMNIETFIAFIIGAFIAGTLAVRLRKVRHEFIVLEGFAGLLYHKGKFAERLDASRHIRWGRHFTITMMDLRKSILNVPGQEILTA